MEDYIIVKNNFLNDKNKFLAVLCDGHCGEIVAKQTIEKLPDLFAHKLESLGLRDDNYVNNLDAKTVIELVHKALTDSFEMMDQDFPQYEECGSTCCVVYICIERGQRVVYSANIGDSRTILVREKEAKRLSYDHKATDKEEVKRVKSEGGLIIRGRLYNTLAVTRAFGDYTFKNDGSGLSIIPTITRTVIENTDRYVITCSDGVWDVIGEVNANNLINEIGNKSSNDIAKVFVMRSMELGSKDNISSIVITLN